MRLLLVNPNTNAATTQVMVKLAQAAAPAGVEVEGATAGFGAPLITDEDALAVAATAVTALVPTIRSREPHAVLIAAFGDPGLAKLRAELAVPVTGLAEAGMAEAARLGPFVVVTTTPALVGAITRSASAYGHNDRFRGVRLTQGDLAATMADPTRLVTALEMACREAMQDRGVAAIVIGGGPLAVAARVLRDRIALPIIEPVPAATRLAIARAGIF